MFILIVDDDAMVRRGIARFLRRIPGVTIFEAGNAHDAITHFSTHQRIKLVLSDVQMPPSNRGGLMLHNHVKDELSRRGGTFVSMTGTQDFEDARTLAANGVDVLDKPLEPERIYELMKKVFALLHPPH